MSGFTLTGDDDDPMNANTGSSMGSNSGGNVVWGDFSFIQSIPAGIEVRPRNEQEGKNYGVRVEIEVPIRGWKDDPYAYVVDFRLKLLSVRDRPPLFIYEASGVLSAPDFNLEDYLRLKRRSAIKEFLPSFNDTVANSKFRLSPIRWQFLPDAKTVREGPKSAEFKKAVREAMRTMVRSDDAIKNRLREAITSFYRKLDSDVADTILDNKDALTEKFKRENGVYDKRHTSEILDLVLGHRYGFHTHDEAHLENGVLSIPRYWVPDFDIEKNWQGKVEIQESFGRGAQCNVITFGIEPYAWAMFLSTWTNNSFQHHIRSRKGEPMEVRREVHIAAYREGRVVHRKLPKEFFGEELADDRVEMLSNLALGELEAQAREEDEAARRKTDKPL